MDYVVRMMHKYVFTLLIKMSINRNSLGNKNCSKSKISTLFLLLFFIYCHKTKFVERTAKWHLFTWLKTAFLDTK
ncbi:hypothetical protein PLEI_3659 [Photobacterium leiognathi lrivu.4.1]|uniref:Uncharacterized protein n=1 Tax=Photobacterium leiognathi lrivu.4.1 TaxID=1248232 RepID=V5F770_PHOLE|nr:hypothetical protein PLEI_3659 [Photobacterium leiognathi lrivu.4.1]